MFNFKTASEQMAFLFEHSRKKTSEACSVEKEGEWGFVFLQIVSTWVSLYIGHSFTLIKLFSYHYSSRFS